MNDIDKKISAFVGACIDNYEYANNENPKKANSAYRKIIFLLKENKKDKFLPLEELLKHDNSAVVSWSIFALLPEKKDKLLEYMKKNSQTSFETKIMLQEYQKDPEKFIEGIKKQIGE